MAKEIEGMREFWDLVAFYPDKVPMPEAVFRLKQAEFLAEEDFEWSSLASTWLDVWDRHGVRNAVRCAWKTLEEQSFSTGILSGAEVWLRILEYEYDETFLKNAWQLMTYVEEELLEYPDIMDMCLSACVWNKFPNDVAAVRARSMLVDAETMYTKFASGQIKLAPEVLTESLKDFRERIDKACAEVNGGKPDTVIN